ncbi:unnamed protein product [Amoebophrya sp. A120]|nr:unnamed protein product [Amoebophrya sp. A120]|eukprot:GSA120T00006211001.1
MSASAINLPPDPGVVAEQETDMPPAQLRQRNFSKSADDENAAALHPDQTAAARKKVGPALSSRKETQQLEEESEELGPDQETTIRQAEDNTAEDGADVPLLEREHRVSDEHSRPRSASEDDGDEEKKTNRAATSLLNLFEAMWKRRGQVALLLVGVAVDRFLLTSSREEDPAASTSTASDPHGSLVETKAAGSTFDSEHRRDTEDQEDGVFDSAELEEPAVAHMRDVPQGEGILNFDRGTGTPTRLQSDRDLLASKEQAQQNDGAAMMKQAARIQSKSGSRLQPREEQESPTSAVMQLQDGGATRMKRQQISGRRSETKTTAETQPSDSESQRETGATSRSTTSKSKAAKKRKGNQEKPKRAEQAGKPSEEEVENEEPALSSSSTAFLKVAQHDVEPPLRTDKHLILDRNDEIVILQGTNWAAHWATGTPLTFRYLTLQEVADFLVSQNFNHVRLTFSLDSLFGLIQFDTEQEFEAHIRHWFRADQPLAEKVIAFQKNAAQLDHQQQDNIADYDVHYDETLLADEAKFTDALRQYVDKSWSFFLLSEIVKVLTERKIMVILNNHVSMAGPCCSLAGRVDGNEYWFNGDDFSPDPTYAHPSNGQAYNEKKLHKQYGLPLIKNFYSERSWLSHVSIIARRFHGNRFVVGFDLRNEVRSPFPEGGFLSYLENGEVPLFWSSSPEKANDHLDSKQMEERDQDSHSDARSGTTSENETSRARKRYHGCFDWATAATKAGHRVLHENPTALVFVELLQFAMYLPAGESRSRSGALHKIFPGRIVYSIHEYRRFWWPWFFSDAGDFPSDLFGNLGKGDFGTTAVDFGKLLQSAMQQLPNWNEFLDYKDRMFGHVYGLAPLWISELGGGDISDDLQLQYAGGNAATSSELLRQEGEAERQREDRSHLSPCPATSGNSGAVKTSADKKGAAATTTSLLDILQASSRASPQAPAVGTYPLTVAKALVHQQEREQRTERVRDAAFQGRCDESTSRSSATRGEVSEPLGTREQALARVTFEVLLMELLTGGLRGETASAESGTNFFPSGKRFLKSLTRSVLGRLHIDPQHANHDADSKQKTVAGTQTSPLTEIHKSGTGPERDKKGPALAGTEKETTFSALTSVTFDPQAARRTLARLYPKTRTRENTTSHDRAAADGLSSSGADVSQVLLLLNNTVTPLINEFDVSGRGLRIGYTNTGSTIDLRVVKKNASLFRRQVADYREGKIALDLEGHGNAGEERKRERAERHDRGESDNPQDEDQRKLFHEANTMHGDSSQVLPDQPKREHGENVGTLPSVALRELQALGAKLQVGPLLHLRSAIQKSTLNYFDDGGKDRAGARLYWSMVQSLLVYTGISWSYWHLDGVTLGPNPKALGPGTNSQLGVNQLTQDSYGILNVHIQQRASEAAQMQTLFGLRHEVLRAHLPETERREIWTSSTSEQAGRTSVDHDNTRGHEYEKTRLEDGDGAHVIADEKNAGASEAARQFATRSAVGAFFADRYPRMDRMANAHDWQYSNGDALVTINNAPTLLQAAENILLRMRAATAAHLKFDEDTAASGKLLLSRDSEGSEVAAQLLRLYGRETNFTEFDSKFAAATASRTATLEAEGFGLRAHVLAFFDKFSSAPSLPSIALLSQPLRVSREASNVPNQIQLLWALELEQASLHKVGRQNVRRESAASAQVDSDVLESAAAVGLLMPSGQGFSHATPTLDTETLQHLRTVFQEVRANERRRAEASEAAQREKGYDAHDLLHTGDLTAPVPSLMLKDTDSLSSSPGTFAVHLAENETSDLSHLPQEAMRPAHMFARPMTPGRVRRTAALGAAISSDAPLPSRTAGAADYNQIWNYPAPWSPEEAQICERHRRAVTSKQPVTPRVMAKALEKILSGMTFAGLSHVLVKVSKLALAAAGEELGNFWQEHALPSIRHLLRPSRWDIDPKKWASTVQTAAERFAADLGSVASAVGDGVVDKLHEMQSILIHEDASKRNICSANSKSKSSLRCSALLPNSEKDPGFNPCYDAKHGAQFDPDRCCTAGKGRETSFLGETLEERADDIIEEQHCRAVVNSIRWLQKRECELHTVYFNETHHCLNRNGQNYKKGDDCYEVAGSEEQMCQSAITWSGYESCCSHNGGISLFGANIPNPMPFR